MVFIAAGVESLRENETCGPTGAVLPKHDPLGGGASPLALDTDDSGTWLQNPKNVCVLDSVHACACVRALDSVPECTCVCTEVHVCVH